jgi:hypothetical protein
MKPEVGLVLLATAAGLVPVVLLLRALLLRAPAASDGRRAGAAPEPPPPDASALVSGLDDAAWERLHRVLWAGAPRASAYALIRLRNAVREQGDPALDGTAALRSRAILRRNPPAENRGAPHDGPAEHDLAR